MDLAFGTNVREHFYSIGRLAGLEADRTTHAVRNILVSPSGTVDDRAERRPLSAVPSDHFDGDIELLSAHDEQGGPRDGAVTLTDHTRLVRSGHPIGHLVGVEVDPGTGTIVSLVGRQHWWTPRVHMKAANADLSVPGEIRLR